MPSPPCSGGDEIWGVHQRFSTPSNHSGIGMSCSGSLRGERQGWDLLGSVAALALILHLQETQTPKFEHLDLILLQETGRVSYLPHPQRQHTIWEKSFMIQRPLKGIFQLLLLPEGRMSQRSTCMVLLYPPSAQFMEFWVIHEPALSPCPSAVGMHNYRNARNAAAPNTQTQL